VMPLLAGKIYSAQETQAEKGKHLQSERKKKKRRERPSAFINTCFTYGEESPRASNDS